MTKNASVWISSLAIALMATACGGSTTTESTGGDAAGSGGAAGGTGGGTAGGGGSGGVAGGGGSGGVAGGGGSGGVAGGGGSGGVAGGGGSGGGYVGGCPDQNPTEKTACTEKNLTCSYGDSYIPSCRYTFVCNSNLQWQAITHPDQQDACKGGSPDECPDAMPANQTECPKPLVDKTTCYYPPEQTRCRCSSFDCSAGPCKQLDPPEWVCQGPTTNPDCPTTLPNLGTACSKPETLLCDYLGGGCAGGTTIQCKNGAWQEAPVACPQ